MKKILIPCLLSVGVLVAVLSGFFSFAHAAQTWSTLPADLVVSMNSGSSGSALSASIMNAGTVSSDCSVGSACSWGTPPGGAFTVGPNEGLTNLGPVSLNGGSTVFAAGSLNGNTVGHNDGVAGPGSNEVLNISAGSATTVSALVGIKLGPPFQSTSGSDWDMMILWNPAGDFDVLQMNSACTASGGYGVRLEIKPVVHSPCIALTPQQSYYFSMHWNINAGTADVTVFTTAGVEVGTASISGTAGGGGLSSVYIGNNENGSSAGTVTYFQNLMLNWTTAPDPYFWTATSGGGGGTTDTTPPTTSITAPANGATVSGATSITASASDNVGVTSVQFYVDGNLVGTDASSPYTFSLNTTSLTNGNHTIQTKASDAAGNVGTSASVTITVNNSAVVTKPVVMGILSLSGTAGSAISPYQISASNGPTSYSASGLPGGLSINTTTGVISGTPTVAGTSNVTISATNSGGTGTATLVITIGAQSSGGSGGSGSGGGSTTSGLWSGVLSPSRATNWSTAGVVGGIPARTNICATLTSSATTAAIDSAITSCSASGGGVVMLGAGTYTNVTTGICFAGASNVTLRGAGANETILAPTSPASCHGYGGGDFGIGLSSGDGNSVTSIANGPVSWSSGYAQGATSITLASVPNLKVGNPIMLDQLDTVVDNGGVLVTQANAAQTSVAPGVNGPYTLDGDAGHSQRCSSGSSPAGCYSQQQMVEVTSCNGNTTVGTACSGSNVTVGISPGLHMANWSAANSPAAWWSTSPAKYDGVEDLEVNATNDSGDLGIELFNCMDCWVKGSSILTTSQSHIQLFYALNPTITNNYLYLTQNAAPASYGIECYSGFNALVENNIEQGVTTPLIANGPCDGSVFAYNFTVNQYYTSSAGYNIPAIGNHGSGDDLNLFEGNITNGHTADVIHGTANLDTDFRNYFTGSQSGCYASGSSYSTAVYETCNNNLMPIYIFAFHRFYNLIGNILGITGINTTYRSSSGIAGSPTAVLGIGYGNGAVPTDPNVSPTLMLWGNADSATGFNAPRFNCSEVPTSLTGAQASYSNPCPSTDALPPSFTSASKPAWWPSSKPWPAIGPDVTSGNVLLCTSGPYINALVTSASQCGGGSSAPAGGGHVDSIPAMDCYLSLGGLPNGTGQALTSFNENNCYSSSSGSGGGTGDTTPPTTSITSPANGATISGTATITASASDNVGVTSVQFYVDGNLVATAASSPYTFALNTTALTNGNHTIQSKASDAAGNTGTSPTVTVTVNNAATVVKPVITSSLSISATAGTAISAYQISASNNPTSYSASGLPSGLSINTSSGVISGTPTAAGTSNVTIGATNSAGTGSATLVITVSSASGGGGTGGSGGHNYTTSFPLTQNPISESGNWVNGGTTGIDWNNVDTTPGLAYGTETGSIDYNDSTAILTGTWGPNQTAQATVHVSNAANTSGVYEEVELRLHTTVTAHSITGYEINCSVSTNSNNNYLQIVRWNGPLGSFTQLDGANDHCVNGSVLKATIANGVITAYLNGSQVEQTTDNTYTGGNPGIGFYLQGGASSLNSNYGFSTFTATDGTTGGGGTGDTTAPTTSITAPANGATVSGTTSLTASASDNVGVTSVQFYVDGNLVGTDTTSPYTFSLNTTSLTNGNHTIQSKASDAAGNVGASSVISVTVNNVPTVVKPVITSSLSASATAGRTFSYQITGSNSPTSYSASGLPSGLSINTTSGLISGTPTAAGTSNVTIGAANSAGTGTAILVITVATGADTTPPTVSIASPTNGTTVSGAVTVSANASDNVGVTSVQFKLDGANLGAPVTSAPYQVSWNTAGATNGAHTISAIASDAAGNMGTAANVAVTVSNSTATKPAITSPLSLTAAVGKATSYQITGSNSPTSYSASGLPSGLSINTTSGLISGTPTAAGTSNVTIGATNSAGTGTAILVITVSNTTDTTPPSVPTGLSANATSPSQVNLSWNASTDNVGVTGYSIYRGGVQIATTAGTTYTSTGLTAGTAYTYTVSAYDAAGNHSAQSAGVNVTTPSLPDTTPPTTSITSPANGATISGTATITASASDNVGVTSVQFYLDGSLVDTANTAPYTFALNTTSLTNGNHTIQAKASDAAGNVGASSIISVTVNNATSGGGGNTTLTVAASVTMITPTTAKVTVANSIPAVTQVFYGPTTSYGQVTSPSTALTTAYFNLTDLTPGTLYHVKAVSVANGKTSSSQDVTFTAGSASQYGNFPPLTQDLYLGITGSQVTELQTLLIQWGYLNIPASGYFGTQTQTAVEAFQSANGLSPAGLVGTLSRTKINSILSGTSSVVTAGAAGSGGTGSGGGNGGGTTTPPVAAPSFIQVNNNNVASGPSNSVGFNSPTTAGNTIIAYVIWDNSGPTTVSDTRGDKFVAVSGPVTWGNGYRAQIFYASNIAGGADTVTAAFKNSVSSFGVLYIHEYSGISNSNPVDTTVMASGPSGSLSSGSGVTTSANDLIFGAGVSSNIVTAGGSGFRVRDTANGNITEDMIASTPGSYGATATQDGNAWGMQMVAFRP